MRNPKHRQLSQQIEFTVCYRNDVMAAGFFEFSGESARQVIVAGRCDGYRNILTYVNGCFGVEVGEYTKDVVGSAPYSSGSMIFDLEMETFFFALPSINSRPSVGPFESGQALSGKIHFER